MFTKSHSWQRWSGPSSELTAAIDLASTVLSQWSGIRSKVEVRISYANKLTETSNDPAALDGLHVKDLRRVRDVWVDIDVDREWWLAETNKYNSHEINMRYGTDDGSTAPLVKPPELVHASASFRLASGLSAGIEVDVRGPDRTSVEGLMARIVDVLDRSTTGPTRVPAQVGFVLLAPVMVAATYFGGRMVHFLNWAPKDNQYQWQEILIPTLLSVVSVGILATFMWAFPTLELLGLGERSRFVRYRSLFLSGLGAVVAGLIATALWTRLA
ncbi:hypothetical protein [Pengzhenrongella phosphoraccumulans]|uniref:hypothetical protein n=1 Tax=Pengzhenrongella phosphoraccumulans TaxID=3114394 RepID=UPI00388DC44A